MMLVMSTTTMIRGARPADLVAIRAVAAAANAEFAIPMGERLFAGYLANVLDVETRLRDATVLVAERDGSIVGTITLYADIHDEGMPIQFPDGTAGIRATAVDPAARGHGVGGALVAAAIDLARADGAARVALHTAPAMHDAMRLYERQGFRRRPEHDYVANAFFDAVDGERLDALAFILDLAGPR
jgi:ribosomal protein S18 acetylase RimI-like enzyme